MREPTPTPAVDSPTLPPAAPPLSEQATVPPEASPSQQGAPPGGGALASQATVTGEERWYYARGKEKVGPLSGGQLRAEASTGRLQPGDMVLHEGTSMWTEARTV